MALRLIAKDGKSNKEIPVIVDEGLVIEMLGTAAIINIDKGFIRDIAAKEVRGILDGANLHIQVGDGQ